jgi:hypothetical protein
LSANDVLPFEEYVATLAPLRGHVVDTEAATAEIREAADALIDLEAVDEAALSKLVAERPSRVPALALVVRLSRERLRNELRHHFGTSGWVRLARTKPGDLVRFLDREFGLVAEVTAARTKTFTLGDVLAARAESRASAGRAVGRGRTLEDALQELVEGLGLAHELRTRFVGRNGQTAPCDLAIPSGAEALIVCAAKLFDSTGSKLTDAVREIEEMAAVRLPRQFVFAVVDGIGWLSRRADLRRIHDLRVAQRIDGLYSLAMLDRFAADLSAAARRVGLDGSHEG